MLTEIDDDLLARAQKGDSAAAAEIYALVTPQLSRLGIGLCASQVSGKAAVGQVMKRSAKVFHRWRDGDEAVRWFTHQLLLFTRRVPRPKTIDEDALYVPDAGPEYRAFLTSIRRAPTQQQEAFLLTSALRWNPRLLAVAMDCSTEAATNHLATITTQLKELSGSLYDELVGLFVQTFRRLPADGGVSPRVLAGRLSTHRAAGKLWWVVQFLFVIAVFGALGYGAWFVWPMLRF